MMTLDYDFFNQVPLRVRDADHIHLVLVGCGGNGSHMAKSIAQICHLLIEQGRKVKATFYDPDVVEEKNIPRQDFYRPEMGLNKAQVLAARWSMRLGVPITGVDKAFSAVELNKLQDWKSLVILVGCVDNHVGRQAMAKCLESNQMDQAPKIWWLDLGNTESAGQVVLGSANSVQALYSAFNLADHCTHLPSPALVYPNLLEPRPEHVPNAHLSCAELAMLNAQSQGVNLQCAEIGTDYLNRMLFGKLFKFCTEFDLKTGTMQLKLITPKAVAEAVK